MEPLRENQEVLSRPTVDVSISLYTDKTEQENKDGFTIEYTPTTGALENGLYYWRVTVGDGYPDPNDATKPHKKTSNENFDFTVLDAPQFTLDISNPGDGSVNSSTPLLTWILDPAKLELGENLESWLRWSNNEGFLNSGGPIDNPNWVKQSWWPIGVSGQEIKFSIPEATTDGKYWFRLEVWDSVPTEDDAWRTKTNATDFNWSSSTPLAGDFNGDGLEDIAVVYDNGTNNTKIYVLESGRNNLTNTSTNNFSKSLWWSNPTGWNRVNSKFAAGDIDGDGDDDLIAIYDYGNNRQNSSLLLQAVHHLLKR
ncbi:hypothetical protein LCGC14_0983070 [marine sediment metagenome]|uniref:VCBS repeat-containing protein n=1 Tax=marine sediment metagenome TaxID=412755 RepID=A0A0F9NUE6_9ZZZZ